MALFTTQITKEQSRDTGLAMSLILILLGLWLDSEIYFKLALLSVLLTMLMPRIYYPIAIFWFGLSNVMGAVMSPLLLTVIFVIFVIPMGLARRIMGKDSLQLNKFKASRESVFRKRDHTFTSQDLLKPY